MAISSFFDFCSGIGGGRLGLERCGLVSKGFSDTSRLSVNTYRIMHDASKEVNFGNLKRIDGTKLPHYDIMIAGFPCQSFSVIGKRTGFEDDRGQIIFHLIRLLQESKPKAFLLENVRGLVSHNKGKSLEIIISELEAVGYVVFFKVLTSLDYGIPHMRQRVYIVGFDINLGLELSHFKWPSPVPTNPLSNYLIDTNNSITEEDYIKLSYYLKNPTNNGKYTPEDLLNEDYLIIDTRMSDLRLYRNKVPTLRSHRDGIFYVREGKIMELTGLEALLLQGFPYDKAKKVKDIVSNRHLLMQAGNAMTVDVIEKIGQNILDVVD